MECPNSVVLTFYCAEAVILVFYFAVTEYRHELGCVPFLPGSQRFYPEAFARGLIPFPYKARAAKTKRNEEATNFLPPAPR